MVVGMRATTATGAMYMSRLSESMRSLESESMRPCSTLLSARPAVAVMAAAKPTRLNMGSAPEAITMPTTTGMREAYTTPFSCWLVMK